MISMKRNRPWHRSLSRKATANSKQCESLGNSFSATVRQSCDSPAGYFKCLLTALVI